MRRVTDFCVDETGDLMVKDGDFVVGGSTLQHIKSIVVAHKGEYKQHPLLGVGIASELLNNTSGVDLKHLIRQQLENDGMKVEKIEFVNREINIDACYP